MPVGQYELDYELDSAYLTSREATELLGGQVSAKARLNLRATDFELYIEVQGEVAVVCDRCLDQVMIPVSAGEQMEVEEDAKCIDLMWLAYELTVVNLPLVHSHPDGECNPLMQDLLQSHLCSTEPEGQDNIEVLEQ